MKTLYDKNRDRCEWLARNARGSIAEMAKHFSRVCDMDDALGYAGAASKWLNGHNYPASWSERRAKEWLDSQARSAAPLPPSAPAVVETTLIAIAGSPENLSKLSRIAQMMGCEVVDV